MPFGFGLPEFAILLIVAIGVAALIRCARR